MGEFTVRCNAVTPFTSNSHFDVKISNTRILNPTDEQYVEGMQIHGAGDSDGIISEVAGNPNPQLGFDLSGASIFLDSAVVGVDVAGLPAGFTIDSCKIRARIFITGTAILQWSVDAVTFPDITASGTFEEDVIGADINDLVLKQFLFFCDIVPGGEVQVCQAEYRGFYSIVSQNFSVTPPSGEVEEGQQITVEGPIEDLEFAFLIGDKVVPVIPKVINPEEVLIEVPAPPSDPCIASIAACPECEDCFTVCEEDLTSAECQACLETCFQCLENELESTEAAEECQQSSQEPPEIPAILICGDPGTQFTGSVTLGTFTIIVANGSGIYRLVPAKTNDTLYTAARDGTTYDVKIPNPGGKTGFFRS